MHAAGVYACGMNPAIQAATHAATGAASAYALASKKIIDHFLAGKAFTPDTAIDPTGLPEHPASVLESLRKQQLVRSTGDGRLYFDRKRHEAQQARARQIGIWMLYAVSMLALVGAAWIIYHT